MSNIEDEIEQLYYKHLGTTIVRQNGQPDHIKIKGSSELTDDILALLQTAITEARIDEVKRARSIASSVRPT